MEKLEEQAKSIAEDARKDKPSSAAAGQKGVLFVRYVIPEPAHSIQENSQIFPSKHICGFYDADRCLKTLLSNRITLLL